eukprot:gnl/MRDRNA2_/MRDRNA2_78644_c0_seq1.p1 gnl/MRDRNA2_/MRDRNA2_78644_c0~~gnl/MRDRNA2_/MRDRNA2_78644_c0_seq1.p1  ORF type:complete len:842 (+),score=227.56 gnl/MRDRNA2_/MRDRNA2_78644_c0_seq1:61-2586(+)
MANSFSDADDFFDELLKDVTTPAKPAEPPKTAAAPGGVPAAAAAPVAKAAAPISPVASQDVDDIFGDILSEVKPPESKGNTSPAAANSTGTSSTPQPATKAAVPEAADPIADLGSISSSGKEQVDATVTAASNERKMSVDSDDAEFAALAAKTAAPPLPSAEPTQSNAPSVSIDADDEEFAALASQLSGSSPSAARKKEEEGKKAEEEAKKAEEEKPYEPPKLPPVPNDFTKEDTTLRVGLEAFYHQHKADNILAIDKIVRRYQGANVSTLWAQLALKYGVEPHEALRWLARTLYTEDAPFEYSDPQKVQKIVDCMKSIRKEIGDQCSRSDLFKCAVKKGEEEGIDLQLRLLCFRGIPNESRLRPKIWKMLLGYLPMARHSEWNAIQGQKRAKYYTRKNEMMTPEGGVQKDEDKELFEEIERDVNRTRRECDFFQKEENKKALLGVLFLFAKLHPSIRYVNGMNEIAAVLLYVMAEENECIDFMEADTFWCFREWMSEMKGAFIQDFDKQDEGVNKQLADVNFLIRTWDFDLACHFQQHDLPPVMFALRWCTLLFSQDLALPDLIRVWDSLLSDPQRFEFCSHFCLALLVYHRQELLEARNIMGLMEILQEAPRSTELEPVLKLAYAICAFERRCSAPYFPERTTSQLMEDFSDWATKMTSVARGGVRKHIGKETEDQIVENVTQIAGELQMAAGVAAMAVGTLLEDSAPQREAAMEKAKEASAQAQAAAAAAAAQAQAFLQDEKRKEVLANASTKLTGLWGWAKSTASAAAAQVSDMKEEFNTPLPPQQQNAFRAPAGYAQAVAPQAKSTDAPKAQQAPAPNAQPAPAPAADALKDDEWE